jgi:uncharacterized membrane protein YuzA (DUF378 family)
MGKMQWYDYTSIVLLAVGGINWGLVGVFNFNLVTTLFGWGASFHLPQIIYVAVGLSGLYSLVFLIKQAFN